MNTEPLTGLVRTAPPAPSRERDELARAVRAVLTRHSPAPAGPDDAPGVYDSGLWKRLADLGLGGLAVPEPLGGYGGDYLDCHAVLVELGRAAVATPYPAVLVATQAALLATGAMSLPPGLPVGTETPGSAETATLVEGLAATDGSGAAGWVVEGRAENVVDGARADVLLAPARTETGDILFALDPAGLARTVLPTMDQTIHLATVTADHTPAVPLGPYPESAKNRIHDLRTIMTTADQIGGARACLEMLVDYLTQRVQFGRPIASFQAVKHRLADLLVLVEAAESASWTAAAGWAEGTADTPVLAAVAGGYCADAYTRVTAETVQLHGGIAITWEHPAHRYFKHAHTTAALFGTPAAHRRRLVDLLRASLQN